MSKKNQTNENKGPTNSNKKTLKLDSKQQQNITNKEEICNQCSKTITQQKTLNCTQCSKKFHQDCINTQKNETQWTCTSCLNNSNKNELPKKKKIHIQDFFTKIPSTAQETKAKKLAEFQQIYPDYVQDGRVIFPILDECLTNYQGLFNIEIKTKPQLKSDEALSENLLKIWDAYNYLIKIINDMIDENINEFNNIGTIYHFKDNQIFQNTITRIQIQQIIKNNPQYLIYFFSLFYLKQIIEDVDLDQMQKQPYKVPFLHLIGYLWHTNRIKYYEILKENILQLPQYFQQLGLLNIDENIIINYENQDQILNVVANLIEGLNGLRKFQFFLSYRAEILSQNNKIKQILEQQYSQLKEQFAQIYKDCSTIDTDQFDKEQEIELQNQISIVSQKLAKNDKESKYQQVPQLLLNTCMFLGYDNKNNLYYFFIWENDKIFVCQNQQWGYYDQNEISNLMQILCQKGIRESHLRNSILELQKAKILIEKKIHNDQTQEDLNKIKQIQELTHNDYCKKLENIEKNLTQYLLTKNSRWCNAELRNTFLKTFINGEQNNENFNYLYRAVEYFIENTLIQEKWRSIEEIEVKPQEQEEEQQQFNRKRKIIEDDSSGDEQQQENQEQVIEQIDNSKVRIRKLPMKLFGTYLEILRQHLLDLLKCNSQLGLCLEVLDQIVKLYIWRKQQQIPSSWLQKKKDEPIDTEKESKLRIRGQKAVDYENMWEDNCKECGYGGKVICCDSCPKVFHAKCAGLNQIPQGKWNCTYCKNEFERQIKTRATLKKLQIQ